MKEQEIDIIDNLKSKLAMFEKFKKECGYDESLFVKDENISTEVYNREILNKIKLNPRRVFNNAYLNECIKQTKLKIEKWETYLKKP